MDAEQASHVVSVDDQCAAILAVLAGDDGKTLARAAVRRLGVTAEVDELLNEAYVRVRRAFRGTTKPRDGWDELRPRLYAARVLDSVVRDRRRSLVRHPLVSLGATSDGALEVEQWPSATGDLAEMVATREALELLLIEISRSVRSGEFKCGGCAPEIVTAAALWIVQSLAASYLAHDPIPTIDELMYTALSACGADDDTSGSRDSASRQRKRRCGACVTRLIREAATRVGLP